MSRSSYFRCPECGAAHHWVVDECDACGYRSEASLGWESEARARRRGEWLAGWNWWHISSIGDIVEIFFWIGRLLWGAVRGAVSLWH